MRSLPSFRFSGRRSVFFAALTAAGLLSGCVVSKSRYEAALTDARREAALRQDAEDELAMTKRALVDTRARLRATAKELDETALALSRVERELAVATSERGSAAERASQLRDELARAAGNHEVLSERMRALTGALRQLDCEIEYGETTEVRCDGALDETPEAPSEESQQGDADDLVADAR